MFFDNKLKYVIAAVFTMTALGCSNEDEPYYEIPKIELSGAACLNEAVNKTDRYFHGDIKVNEVNEIWDCFSYALRTFRKYVHGKNNDYYQAEELSSFLETYFLKQSISQSLLEEMMGIKKLFLGGSNQIITNAEIERTYYLIESFRKISLDLFTHLEFIFQKNKNLKPTSAKTLAAESALIQAASNLVLLLNTETSRYEIEHLSRLLKELHLFFYELNSQTSFGEVDKFIPLFAKLKELLLNSSALAIEPNEWVDVAKIISQFTGLYLRGVYNFSEERFYRTDSFALISSASTQFAQILLQSLSRRKDKTLASTEFNNIFNELEKINSLPLGMTLEETKKIFYWFTDFVLNPQNTNPINGVTVDKINYLENAIGGWAYVQNLLIENKEDLQNSSWQQMKGVLQTPWSLNLDEYGRLVLDGSQLDTNIKTSTQLNWARSLISILMHAYITDESRKPEPFGLQKSELHQVVLDLSPLLVGLKLIDRETRDFDKAIFRDANLFMSRSNGDSELNLYELVEFLHMALSGVKAGELFINESQVECRIGSNEFAENCFRQVLPQKAQKFLKHLPLYLNYSDNISDSQWQKNISNIESASRVGGPSTIPMTFAEVYKSFIMIQYIEIMMLRFDKDYSSDVNISEGLVAFEHFSYVLGEMLRLDPIEEVEELESIFTYMLRYGVSPDPSDPLAGIRFANWKWQRSNWQVSTDRGLLLQILSGLNKL